MSQKTALIFGITGQDGSYLAELLLAKGYQVHGLSRATSFDNRTRIADALADITIHDGDLADAGSIWRVMRDVQPDEIYNLAGTQDSFTVPEHSADINALGTVRILEAMRSLAPGTKFFQIISADVFGQGCTATKSLNEQSSMQPVSPYGAAKHYAYNMVRIYRQAYGLFACTGIAFDHASPRSENPIIRFARGVQDGTWDGEPLRIGNLDVRRDWGHAGDYVDGMWRIMQANIADDFVLATCMAHSLRDFVDAAIPGMSWFGSGADEKGYSAQGRLMVVVDANLDPRAEIQCLIGDASKAFAVLGWQPKTRFKDMITEMMDGA
jgi:GDPmannose 4,6-dehydratase